MYGNQNSLPECSDITVDLHLYNVIVYFMDNGDTVMNTSLMAGSIAHASLLVGMTLCADLVAGDYTPEEAETFMHNLSNHVNVDVQLIV